MLKSIHLKNFKAFGRKIRIPFSRLTILCGPNNSGKSSVFHSLLLLKQTNDSESTDLLCSVGRYGSFGAYRDLAHSRSIPWIQIGMEVVLPKEIPAEYVRRYLGFGPGFKKGTWLDMDVKLHLNFGEDLKSECGFRLGQSSLSLSVQGARRRPSLAWNAHRLVHTKEFPLKSRVSGLPLQLSNFWPHYLAKQGHEYNSTPLPAIFRGALPSLYSYVRDIGYLGPLREAPHRYYVLDKELFSDLGVRGENTWNALAHSPVKEVSFFDISRNKQRRMSLLDAVNWWLKYCGIADQIVAKKRPGDPIYQVLLKGDFKGTRSIVDLGFGVSQILPLFVMGLLGEAGSLLLFEQPEIHVHPAIQARLADFFVALAKSGKQIAIETHSEHIINRVRTRILEESLGQDEIAILSITKDDEQDSQFENIRFRPDGQIANWPKGFFDTQVDEVKAQNQALKKRIRLSHL